MPEISIIVPIYNSERYLNRLLNSILSQSYNDFELLLIDDGSTDNSITICKYYLESDNRIFLFKTNRVGPGMARNKGLDNAKGKYICFVDSDDWVETDYLEQLHNAIRKSDISICFYKLYRKGKFINCGRKTKFRGKSIKYWKLKLGPAGYESVWNKMYRKSLFDDIRFTKDKTGEDTKLIYTIVRKSNLISVIPYRLYNYNVNHQSVTHQVDEKESILNSVSITQSFINNTSFSKKDKNFISFLISKYISTSTYCHSHFLVMDEIKQMDEIIGEFPAKYLNKKTTIKLIVWKFKQHVNHRVK